VRAAPVPRLLLFFSWSADVITKKENIYFKML
jgi:hypothetical protein